MSKTALIVIGVVCLILLVLLLLVIVPRVKADLSRMPVWGYLLAVLVLAGVLVFVGIGLFGPKGADSILSEDVTGDEKGDQEMSAPAEAEAAAFLNGALGDSGTVVIRVNGTEIWLGSAQLSGPEDLKEAADSLKKELTGRNVRLEDDYALSRTWKEVKRILDERGIRYSEKTLE